MPFDLSVRDRGRLKNVHPDLVRVVMRAAGMASEQGIRFRVEEGVRTAARQRELVRAGFSRTMNSRHIPAKNGYGHAVDLLPLDSQGKPTFAWPPYHPLARIVFAAANEEGVPIEWGGHWKSFKDGPHWQLPWAHYPGNGAADDVKAAEPYTARDETKLARSRTMQGLGLASIGVATHQFNEAAGHVSAGTIAGYVAGGLVLIGLGIAAYARWDDAGRPLPWRRKSSGRQA